MVSNLEEGEKKKKRDYKKGVKKIPLENFRLPDQKKKLVDGFFNFVFSKKCC